MKTILRPNWSGHWQSGYAILAVLRAWFDGVDLIWTRETAVAEYATRLRIPTILENHHPLPSSSAAPIRRMMNRPSFLGFVAISGAHKRLLVAESALSEAKLIVGHSAVASDVSTKVCDASTAQTELNLWGPVALYSGNLYPGKGPEVILDAAQRQPDVHFVCVGGSVQAVEALRSRVECLGLTNFTAVGSVPQREVYRYLAAADVLLLPYTAEMRGVDGKVIGEIASPLKLFEYMAVGRPIVASGLGAVEEVLRHRDTAWLINPGDSAALASAVDRLISDTEIAARLASAAQHASRDYTWEARARRVLAAAGFH